MISLIKRIAEFFGRPHRVEFDYSDSSGMHHGRCYVRYLFAGDQHVKRILRSLGYTNIHIM